MAGFVSGVTGAPRRLGLGRLEGLSPAEKTPVPALRGAEARGSEEPQVPGVHRGPAFLPDTRIHGLPGPEDQTVADWTRPEAAVAPAGPSVPAQGERAPRGRWCSQHQLPEPGPLTALNPILWIRGGVCQSHQQIRRSVTQGLQPNSQLAFHHPWPGHLMCACSVAQSCPTL